MQSIRSILVVLDPRHAESLALKRAKLIASVTQAHLHLLICDKNHDHGALLRVLRTSLLSDGFSVTTEQAWDESLHHTIIGIQQTQSCGLVIKQHAADNPLKKALLTPVDWKLMRYCPTPVLLVKTQRLWTNGVILAAVDVGNDDSEHRALHTNIIDYGHALATLANAQLHVISAHPTPMLAAADPAYHLRETIEGHYRQQCRAFQKQFGIDNAHMHMEEGPADVLIPHLAHTLHAALTVIGCVARTGFSGALIGNTAEVVLDELESDVLVLKPKDIMTHLQTLAAGQDA